MQRLLHASAVAGHFSMALNPIAAEKNRLTGFGRATIPLALMHEATLIAYCISDT